MPWKQPALKRCIRIDIRWNRNDANLGSSVAAVKRSPNSERNFSSLKFIGPSVSMASGTKTWNYAIADYLLSFLEASPSATIPTVILAKATYVAASVSATVTSHVRHLLPCRGMRLRPSGRFLSERERLAGSFDRLDAGSR